MSKRKGKLKETYKDTNKELRLANLVNGFVDAADQPIKHLGIQEHAQRISSAHGLLHCHCFGNFTDVSNK